LLPGGSVGGGAIVLAVALVAVLLLGDGGEQQAPAEPDERRGRAARPAVSAEVLRVVDGDTIEVSLDGTVEDVRYIGVDTPETVKPGSPVECYGPQASEFNRRLVAGKRVTLRFDRELRDDYGRLLAYVFAGPRMVNAALVSQGYARTLEIEPNTGRAGLLARLQQQAAVAGKGLWGGC
jgi:micrococcal nuclease